MQTLVPRGLRGVGGSASPPCVAPQEREKSGMEKWGRSAKEVGSVSGGSSRSSSTFIATVTGTEERGKGRKGGGSPSRDALRMFMTPSPASDGRAMQKSLYRLRILLPPSTRVPETVRAATAAAAHQEVVVGEAVGVRVEGGVAPVATGSRALVGERREV